MSCIQRITRITLAFALTAATLAIAPAPAAAGPRIDPAPSASEDAGTSASWSPWRLLESLLTTLYGADEDPGEGESDGGEGGGGEDPVTGGPADDDPEPPTCPAQQSGGPCSDPHG